MYIVPTGQLKILRNVPVDADYQNTIYFGNGENARQASVFAGYAKFTFDDHSYQRVTVNKIRVGVNAERLYDCNYLMFQNSVGFGSYMWFYAFIDSITYINNSVSEIEYTIDSLQTYLTYINFNMCFIERQHTPTDNVGDNIVPEGIELGEQVFNSYGDNLGFTGTGGITPIYTTGGNPVYNQSQRKYELPDMCIIVSEVTTDTSSGTLYDGTYSGSKLTAYPCTDAGINEVITLVQSRYANPDSINAIYMCPKYCTGLSSISNTGTPIEFGATGNKTIFTGSPLLGSETLDGYVPINKKLYTYPYNYLHIDNANGSGMNLRYEYFAKNNQNQHQPSIEIGGNVTYPLQVVLQPLGYKGSGGNVLHTEQLSINDYPMCSWNVDTYKVWSAQNKVPMLIDTASSIAGTAISATSALAFGKPDEAVRAVQFGGSNIISHVAKMLSDNYRASIAADTIKGNFTNKGANYSLNYQHFYFGRISVQHEYAKMIDDYFSRYGYAIKKLQVPNLNARPEFTYIKTIGCTINGSVPADDERKICSIMDSGITFWNNPANVGQYGLNNVPV